MKMSLHSKLSSNPNFVHMIGACVTPPNDFWLVLEFMPGGSLFDVIHGITRNIRIQSINAVALSVADGMTYLHNQVPQIIHRDLTPSNVLLDAAGNARIADFGISRFKFEVGSANMTYIGNPRWRAPEVTRGEAYSASVDVYAFGLLVWEMFSGKVPFQDLEGPRASYEAAQGRRPEIPQSCPAIWAELIRSCWDPDPSKRPFFSQILQGLKMLPIVQPIGTPTLPPSTDINMDPYS